MAAPASRQHAVGVMKALLAILPLLSSALLAGAQAPSDIFDREPVRFRSGRFQLVGDLLKPRGEPPHPAIVYVFGSGPTNRQRHIERSPVLRVFLERGFAVLLYDKPGSGESTGEFSPGRLFEERASILIDAIGFLGQHAAVRADAIGLYGSSQASYVLAVALNRSDDISFLIAWSCPMQSSIEQSAYLVRNYVLCETDSTQLADLAQAAFLRRRRARSYADYREAATLLDGIASIRDGLGWAGIAAEEEFSPIDPGSEDLLDPSEQLDSLSIPTLALFAEYDRQIDPVQGADAFRRLLGRSGQRLSKVEWIDGADHNMNLSPRGCMQDQRDGYRSLGGATIAPQFLASIDAWLRELSLQLRSR
jgi:pimeloyl-ACP methyl ester carboxylesterase